MSFDWFSFYHYELGLAGVGTGLFLVLLLYCLLLYRLPGKRRHGQDPEVEEPAGDSLPPASVIIYAEDDAERIRRHVPAFLTQDYPQFEVIVVGDDISEACVHELSLLKRQYPQLYYTCIPKGARYISKKKLALTLGIKAARYERIFFTESDCEPQSEHWLRAMASAYAPSVQLVVGCCSYPYNKGWRNKFIAFDNLKNSLQYVSAGLLRRFYSGTGKNLSYTKDLFFANKGFYNQLYLKIGEDSLFINGVATPGNASVCYSAESIMRMDEVLRLKSWTIGRIARIANRPLCKNRFYRLFTLEDWLCWLFWIVVLLSVGLGFMGNYLLSLYAFLLLCGYYGVKSWVFRRFAHLLGQRIPKGGFLLLDVAHHVYSLYIGIISRFHKKRNYVFIIEK